MISYNLMWNKSYLIFILNNYRYDNYLNSNRYNELNVSEDTYVISYDKWFLLIFLFYFVEVYFFKYVLISYNVLV
jgi:hypothetical protein